MQALNWTAESSMDDIGRRYAAAHSQYFEPFLSRHAVHAGALPGQLRSPDAVSAGSAREHRGLSVHHIANTIRDQCMLMMVHYAIIQTVLIGMAAFHKEEFGTSRSDPGDSIRHQGV